MADEVANVRVKVEAEVDEQKTDATMKKSGERAAKAWAENFTKKVNETVSKGIEDASYTSLGKKLFGRQTYNVQNKPTGYQGGLLSGMINKAGAGGEGAGLLKTGLALGAIAGALAIIADAVKNLGPIMGILKMISAIVTLTLRPIAELLLVFLKPIFFLLLKYVIIPFYQYAVPFFKLFASGKQGSSALELTTMPGILSRIIKIFEALAPEIIRIVKEWGTALWGGLNDIGGKIGTVLSGLWDSITKGAQDAISNASAFGGWLWSTITDWVSGSAGNFSDFAGWLWNTVTGWVSVKAKSFLDFPGWLWGTTTGWILEKVASFLDFAKWLWDTATGWVLSTVSSFGNLGSWLWDIVTGWISNSLGFGGGGGGARASGGPVNAGQPYVVGEQGPELFMPASSGSIVPNNKLGGGTVNINNPSFSNKNDIDYLIRELERRGYVSTKRAGAF